MSSLRATVEGVQNAAPQVAYECNGEPVSAQAFYAIACNPRRNVAIEACAGAGKTWILVSRIVRALLDGADPITGELRVQPHEILAITFTKRAAGEMRARLQEWLEQFAMADSSTLISELAARGVETGSDAEQLNRLANSLSTLHQTTLACERQVQIRTFHSWFAALLRNAPLAVLQQLQLPVVYELLEDDSQAKSLAMQLFFKAVLQDAHLRADFEALVLEHGRFQAEKALLAALDKRVEFTLADERGVVDASVLHFSVQFRQFVGLEAPEDFVLAHPGNMQVMRAAAAALGAASAPTFSAAGVELERAITQKELPSAIAALMTLTGTPRKFSEKVLGLERVRLAQALMLQVLAGMAQHKAWQHQMRMGRLTRVLITQYGDLKRSRGWVDMNDVERAARFMLEDAVLSGWVQQRLDTQVKHVLIDEFQDTNPLQWQALLSWLGSYAGSGGGSAPSVFLVGDPKQSIYRFRRAEPQVFKAAQAFVREGLQGDLLSCDHTWRNAKQIIATVNQVMTAAQAGGEFDGFRTHTTGSSEVGWIGKLPPIPKDGTDVEPSDSQVAPVAPRPEGHWRDSLTEPQLLPEDSLRTLEARQAAGWIAKQIASGIKPENIMVLSRKRASLAPLQEELLHLQIAAQIGESVNLVDRCEVQDIVALMDVLVSTSHDLSMARVLKSPIFALDDDVLVELALLQQQQPQKHAATWFDLLQESGLLSDRLKPLGSILMHWKTWVDQLPPHDALQAIFDDGDLLARFAQHAPPPQRTAVLANLQTLLIASLQAEGGRFVTPYRFVRALKAGIVKAPAAVVETAVRLLTIHGAKGLEADVVLVLDTDTKERPTDTMGVLVDWPGESAQPVKFVFLASENHAPACAQSTLEFEVAQRNREEMNALYVAMTRARIGVAISSMEPTQENPQSWWTRLCATQLMTDLDLSNALPSQAPLGFGLNNAEPHFCLAELPLMDQTANQSDSGAHGTKFDLNMATRQDQAQPEDVDSPLARIGKAMHRLLEWGDVSDACARAVAREFDLLPSQACDAQTMAQQILQGEGAWVWSSELIAWAANEVGLVYQGELMRLDRLVQLKASQVWWVLDYKSNPAPQDDPTLMAQLARYREAVQAIYPSAVVQAAFLTGQGLIFAI